LTKIHYNGTKEQWNAISNGSGSCIDDAEGCTVYCTDGEIKK